MKASKESFKSNEISKLRSIHAALNDCAFNLLSNILSIDFEKRFNTLEVLNHPYLDNFHLDENDLNNKLSFDVSFEIEVNKI